jgi:hypothetical protein
MKIIYFLLLILTCGFSECGSGEKPNFTVVQNPPEFIADPVDCTTSNNLVYVDNSIVTGTMIGGRADYPVSLTLDNNENSFLTTNEMFVGNSIILNYDLGQAMGIHSLEFYDNYTNQYAMGDMNIKLSTDGRTWIDFDTIYSSSGLYLNGKTVVNIYGCNIRFVKITMTYMSSGAFGGSPSFYLGEIRFKKYYL